MMDLQVKGAMNIFAQNLIDLLDSLKDKDYFGNSVEGPYSTPDKLYPIIRERIWQYAQVSFGCIDEVFKTIKSSLVDYEIPSNYAKIHFRMEDAKPETRVSYGRIDRIELDLDGYCIGEKGEQGSSDQIYVALDVCFDNFGADGIKRELLAYLGSPDFDLTSTGPGNMRTAIRVSYSSDMKSKYRRVSHRSCSKGEETFNEYWSKICDTFMEQIAGSTKR